MAAARKKTPRHNSNLTAETSLQGGIERHPQKFIGSKALRIIGGDLKRRSVTYNGDRATRPMKDNIRENLFNILGSAVKGTTVWDLFAGTAILAIESLSRGAERAIVMDASRGCIQAIRESARSLGVYDRVDILQGDSFRLAATRLRLALPERRVVFCCPPYAMWTSHREALCDLVSDSAQNALDGSIVVCEMDRRTTPEFLPGNDWDIRSYGNVTLAFGEVWDGRLATKQ